MIKKEKSYSKIYDSATKHIILRAENIHSMKSPDITVQYTLPDISRALRDLYKIESFRNKFVGADLSENNWTKGFCALSSSAIFELYGADKIWDFGAIYPADWSNGPVVYLIDKKLNIPFDTTGDQFAPLVVPYELGKTVDKSRVRTPNKMDFIDILLSELQKNKY